MKFSYQWLAEQLATTADVATLCAQLNNLGLEVEAVAPVAGEFSGVLVGKVLSVAPHPDADKLRVTQVDIGQSTPLQIVCGAPNVREGMFAPTAVVGAQLPGVQIKEAKLRGVASSGMLCSAAELGIDGMDSGLWELPSDLPVGADLRQCLQLDDQSIELSLTPNRADALSVHGVARDLAALAGKPLAAITPQSIAVTLTERPTVHLAASEACPVYAACRVNLPAGARTPLWMQERLRRSGVRSLGLWVDVTNYVMLELGQPMHAFDANKITGTLQVRQAHAGESFTLLDGKTVTLDADMLVIADDSGAIALAGIMGGASTAVSDGTTQVVLESAHFTPAALVGRARRLGLHTDASHRFERGVDPLLPLVAMQRACELLAAAGATCGDVVIAGGYHQQPTSICLRRHSIARLLGLSIDDAQVERLLTGLGMSLTAHSDGWQVTAPSWRFDMHIEADLIEELARMIGLDQLPKLPLPATTTMASMSQPQQRLMRIKQWLVARDYQEAITYSFVDAKTQALIEPDIAGINLANPIAETLGQMRTSLWTGLLAALRYNLNRQQKRVRLFETGLRFLPETDAQGLPTQIDTLAGVVCGSADPVQWASKTRAVDFFDVKGDIESLLAHLGVTLQLQYLTASHPALHPGQSARILWNERPIGWLGKLHPSLAKPLDVDANTLLFSLDLAPLLSTTSSPAFQGLSKFPLVRRDLAVVVDKQVPYEQLKRVVCSVQRPWFNEVSLFDIYEGTGLADHQRSVGLSLSFQHLERTLTDDEIDACIAEIVAQLAQQLSAHLR